MTKENKVEEVKAVEEATEDSVVAEPEVAKQITSEELELIKTARERISKAVLEAEKAVAIKQIAELEYKNIVLGIYNKYKLTAGMDSILEDGVIVPSVGEKND